jgi:large subunit ribosomal protein L38e
MNRWLIRNDSLAARIKRNRQAQQIKFKVRCQRFVYSLVLKDTDKADKLKQSLPPGASLSSSRRSSRPARSAGYINYTV